MVMASEASRNAPAPRGETDPALASALLARYEVVPIGTLRAHPRNYQTHPEVQAAHLRASLTMHEQYKNVVTAEDLTLLAGHGLVEAARAVGKTHVVIVRMPYAYDDPRAQALMVGDNEIERLAHKHDQALAQLLEDLVAQAGEPLLLGTGFDAAMLEALSLEVGPLAAGGVGQAAPADFAEVDSGALPTDYACPSCGYEWSGSAKPRREAQ